MNACLFFPFIYMYFFVWGFTRIYTSNRKELFVFKNFVKNYLNTICGIYHFISIYMYCDLKLHVLLLRILFRSNAWFMLKSRKMHAQNKQFKQRKCFNLFKRIAQINNQFLDILFKITWKVIWIKFNMFKLISFLKKINNILNIVILFCF